MVPGNRALKWFLRRRGCRFNYLNGLHVQVYQKILVAVDGSKPSIAALDHAVRLAKRYGSQVTVITVVEELKLPFAAQYGLWADESHQKLFRAALEENNRLVGDIKMREKSLLIDSVVLEGRPAEKIVEHAAQGRYDLIALGGKGYGGIEGAIIGSVASAVVDRSPLPVLIVK